MGIVYGITRQRANERKENRLREIEERERPAKEAAKAAEKQRLYRGNEIFTTSEAN